MKALAAIVLLALALAWAGSQGGMVAVGVPVFALCALAAFALQWLAYVPAYLAQTERFYDLVGSFNYLLLGGLALALTAAADERSLLLASLVALWAVRLGTFLFLRIRRDGLLTSALTVGLEFDQRLGQGHGLDTGQHGGKRKTIVGA